MQSAATLLGAIRDRGSRGLPLERVYRHLFNRELYLQAFARIASNEGALTPGVTAETADGMSLAKIDAIIEALRFERYRWTPARRIYIEKKNSTKLRPLGIPVWSDKLLQEVLRMILEAYFEPQFSPCSHGFRLGRGCHTALQEIKKTWLGTTWFVEGDIAACFDSFDHSVMLSILGDKIHDGRFLRLMKGLLEAGYLEEWTFNATLSGTPQGGVVSPILSNIYLDRLDKFVETTLLEAHNRGTRRQSNRFYARTQGRARYLASTGRAEEARALRGQAQAMPSVVLNDPDFRRLRYLRYADLCRHPHKSAYAEDRIMPRNEVAARV
jgi:group II intron reverse transcriptase/maturase